MSICETQIKILLGCERLTQTQSLFEKLVPRGILFESQHKVIFQAPVVQTLDSAIHWINHYPLDNSIGFASVYPLDSDLSGGQRYPLFEQLGPGV